MVLLAPDSTKAAALLADGRVEAVVLGAFGDDLLALCQANGVEVVVASSKAEFEANVPQSVSTLVRVTRIVGFSLVPAVMVGALIVLVLRVMRGGALRMQDISSFMGMGARSRTAEKPTVRFTDVAGVEGAKLELQEVVDFLKHPDKYSALGAKIPKGCLLVGPPGTGKTLLARAVAGEAGVPFFSCAASEFVEIFVGVGASRVRDLFEKAKKAAPCIIFIDELDAVGRQRGIGIGGGSDEREQTINQLLNEMDGFDGNTGVIVLSATNRPDVLDTALLRPGRFDRRITVDLPDVHGRLAILRIHAANKPLSPDVDLSRLAARTPGFSGADLANLMNEAAIQAARRCDTHINAADCADALETIALGPQKGSPMIAAKKALVAYHEAGHAIVGALMPDYDRIDKISIVPRTASAGVTVFTPSEERLTAGFYSRSFLLSRLSVALGGRAAEEIAFGREAVTTGAADDLRAVTQTARSMVEVAGLSRRFTHAALRSQGGAPAVLGRGDATDNSIAMATADEADAEVRAIVDEAYRRALRVLADNAAALHRVAQQLIALESMDGSELEALLAEENAQVCRDLRIAGDAPAP